MLQRTGIIALAAIGLFYVSACGGTDDGPPDTASLEKLEVPGRVDALFGWYCWPGEDGSISYGFRGNLQTQHYVGWSADSSKILFDVSRDPPYKPADLYSVEADGSRLEKIVDTKARNPVWGDGSGSIYFDISPDGSRIVYSTCAFTKVDRILGGDEWYYGYEIVLSNIDGSEVRRLTEDKHAETFPEWSPDGNRIAYLANVGSFRTHLMVHTLATGESKEVVLPIGNLSYQTPIRWSPDGEKMAFVENIRDPSLYTVKVDGSELTRIADAASGPAWSPDGKRIAVVVRQDDENRVALYTFAVDGSDPQLIEDDLPAPWKIWSDPWMGDLSWSPDGSEIMLDGLAFKVPLDGSSAYQPLLLAEPFAAAWSPDGTKIAIRVEDYGSTSMGATGPLLYILDRDDTDLRVLVKRVDKDDPEQADRVLLASDHLDLLPDNKTCSDGLIARERDMNSGLLNDCESLLSIKDRLISLDTPFNWSPSLPMGAWDGVILGRSPLRVHILLLEQHSLTGTLPPEFGNLTALRRLSIDNNYLGGTIPPQLGNLTSLETLSLPDNYLSGPIPPELGNLVSLKTLQLKNNRLSGPIPPELGDLGSLEMLSLHENRLTGPIPPELGKLAALRTLYLHSNEINGPIPVEMAGLVNLEELGLPHRGLLGCVPIELPSDWVWATSLEYCSK